MAKRGLRSEAHAALHKVLETGQPVARVRVRRLASLETSSRLLSLVMRRLPCLDNWGTRPRSELHLAIEARDILQKQDGSCLYVVPPALRGTGRRLQEGGSRHDPCERRSGSGGGDGLGAGYRP